MATDILDMKMKAVPAIIVRPWTAVSFVAMAAAVLSPVPRVGVPYPAVEAFPFSDHVFC